MSRPALDSELAGHVQDATARYLQILDTLTEPGSRAPSVLPGWTRGHVVAHLARHGLEAARAMDEVLRGRDPVLYASAEQRAADIEALAGVDLDELRRTSLEAAGTFGDAVGRVLAHGVQPLAQRRIRLFPHAGPMMDVTDLVLARWREVEIHHADLAGGYGPADWPAAFTEYVLDVVTADRAAECDLALLTPERKITVGKPGGLRVEGTQAGLAWWLLGRPAVPELTGRLPPLAPWVRRPAGPTAEPAHPE